MNTKKRSRQKRRIEKNKTNHQKIIDLRNGKLQSTLSKKRKKQKKKLIFGHTKCPTCDKKFTKLSDNHVYCSKQCRINKPKNKKWKSYKHYLKSKVWEQIREQRLEHDNYKCVHCKELAEAVHHKKYVQWGKEKQEHLESICNKCHSIIHDKIGELK
jgi:5-methylcytosine-specific restriction endonuclease McrA